MRSTRKRMWGWLLLMVIAMLTTVCANAQMTGKGTITGTVADATGAVIPTASVNATNDATGITAKTTTTSAGEPLSLFPGIFEHHLRSYHIATEPPN